MSQSAYSNENEIWLTAGLSLLWDSGGRQGYLFFGSCLLETKSRLDLRTSGGTENERYFSVLTSPWESVVKHTYPPVHNRAHP